MKLIYLIIIFFSATLMFPGIAYDPLIDYYRLKQHYIWLVPEVYYCIYNEVNKYPEITMDDVCAIIQLESGNARHNNIERMKIAISSSGAIGLMQIMPFHHKRGPRTDLYNPALNIMYGTRYYTWCLRYTKGNKKEALRCYNAGPASVATRYGGYKTYATPIINNSKVSAQIYNKHYEVR